MNFNFSAALPLLGAGDPSCSVSPHRSFAEAIGSAKDLLDASRKISERIGYKQIAERQTAGQELPATKDQQMIVRMTAAYILGLPFESQVEALHHLTDPFLGEALLSHGRFPIYAWPAAVIAGLWHASYVLIVAQIFHPNRPDISKAVELSIKGISDNRANFDYQSPFLKELPRRTLKIVETQVNGVSQTGTALELWRDIDSARTSLASLRGSYNESLGIWLKPILNLRKEQTANSKKLFQSFDEFGREISALAKANREPDGSVRWSAWADELARTVAMIKIGRISTGKLLTKSF